MEIVVSSTLVYGLVFTRFMASIALNPIFSRRNMPMMVRIGFVMVLTLLIAPLVNTEGITEMSEIAFILHLFKEVLIGFVFAYLAQLFQFMLFFVGDLLDYHFGLSMAKIFDPSTTMQVSSVGNYLQVIFVVMFFVSGAHLHLIRLIVMSFEYMPLFEGINILAISSYVMDAFLDVFMIVLKLALPFIFVQFVLEISMGVLMKLIPQIHVFVINIQLKVLSGIILLILMLQPITHFIDEYIGTMIKAIQFYLLVS